MTTETQTDNYLEQCQDYENTLHDILELLRHDQEGCCEPKPDAAYKLAFNVLNKYGVFS